LRIAGTAGHSHRDTSTASAASEEGQGGKPVEIDQLGEAKSARELREFNDLAIDLGRSANAIDDEISMAARLLPMKLILASVELTVSFLHP
jgi:hypothetical protein